jgi:hypothetical protein
MHSNAHQRCALSASLLFAIACLGVRAVDALPPVQAPEVFGLSANADISRQLAGAEMLLGALQATAGGWNRPVRWDGQRGGDEGELGLDGSMGMHWLRLRSGASGS